MKPNKYIVIEFLLFIFLFCEFSSAEEKKENKLLVFPSPFVSRSIQINKENSSRITNSQERITQSINSTIVFEESFESSSGFPPAGWITVNNDGGGTTGPWFIGNSTVFEAFSGNQYAAANYQGANEYYIDEWLISPKITGITINDTLQFWHRSPDDSPWYDSIEVRISLSDTSLSSFNIRVDYFKTSTNGWKLNRYPLGDYVESGNNGIYIAFRYLIYYGGPSGINSDYIGLDLVQITRPQVTNDIAVTSIDFPSDGGKVIVGQPIQALVTYKNAGTVIQNQIPVRWRILSPAGNIYESNKVITSLEPGSVSRIKFDNYIPPTPGIYKISAYSFLFTDQNRSNDSLNGTVRGAVPLSGIFTVGEGGEITSIKSVIDTINHNVIAGNIIFSLIDSIYYEPPLTIGPISYLTSPYRILLKPASGITPTININATPLEQYGFALMGTAYFTIDGSNSYMPDRNTNIHVHGVYGKTGIFIGGNDVAFADSNVIKNLKITNGADSLNNAENYTGILIKGFSSTFRDYGNVISNCEITNHGSVGIAAQWQEGIFIENNFIHDWQQIAGDNNVYGIFNGDGAIKSVIRNNIIGNIRTGVNFAWAVGIENSAGEGSGASIYNNFIYNILSFGAGTYTNRSVAIFSSNFLNSNDRYCYNSIYLSGTDYSSSIWSYTTGIEIAGGSGIIVKNNIICNESILSATGELNKTYGIYLLSIPANFVSDYNIFYTPSPQGAVGYNNGVKLLLGQWSRSFSPQQDKASKYANPGFISKTEGNLHVDPDVGSPANGAALPIDDITKDIDGNPRNMTTPDIGADEFIPGGILIRHEYKSGWNLVSVPLFVENYKADLLFSGSTSSAFTFRGSYVAQETLTNGAGYWIKFDTPTTVEFFGLQKASDTITVKKGWNLIGCTTDSLSINSIIQVPAEIVISNYYKYDDGFIVVDTLYPALGYWVKVKQDGDLILR